MILKKKLLVATLVLLFGSCNTDLLEVDINGVEVQTKFTHLDSILFYTPISELPETRKNLNATIQEIFDYQIGYCMRIGKVEDTAFTASITQYRQDPAIIKLEQEIAQEFASLNKERNNLIVGLRTLKAHLPQAKIPSQIVFQNTLFNSSAFCTENEIGIGLEQYLGKKSATVKSLPSEPFYDWIKEGFDRTYMERDAILSWVITHILPEVSGNLAEEMIYYGKALYITEAAFPKFDKHIILRYNKSDYKWANDNEYSLWKYLVDENSLFKTDERMLANMVKEGPFTPGLPEKGPDRLGQFLGWKMVRNYMQKTKISIAELIDIPYNEILQKYEPK